MENINYSHIYETVYLIIECYKLSTINSEELAIDFKNRIIELESYSFASDNTVDFIYKLCHTLIQVISLNSYIKQSNFSEQLELIPEVIKEQFETYNPREVNTLIETLILILEVIKINKSRAANKDLIKKQDNKINISLCHRNRSKSVNTEVSCSNDENLIINKSFSYFPDNHGEGNINNVDIGFDYSEFFRVADKLDCKTFEDFNYLLDNYIN
jgi:hypothetical protein